VAWFLGQSLLIIVAAILLGLLVGWLLWGRLVLRQHRIVLADKDAQIQRLHAQLAELDRPVAPDSVPAVDPEPAGDAPEATPAAEADEAQEPEVQESEVAEPEVAERDDELERVEGIGPKMAGALRQAGIRSYAQLAAADETALRAALESAGLKFAPSLTTWSRQARLLADGDEEGFADLVRRLVAGRDVGRS
jgi:predicted flap endonuclease-1-like 5' DNA nuclease